MTDAGHQERILDQFTRQATPFSTANTITDANALRMIVEAAAPGPGDTVLDVACGGGIIVCAFAPEVKHATGIDMTPAMLDRARALAAEKGVANVSWDQGDVGSLPYADGTFDIVVTRFSMHHFLDPISVLREMLRVCAPGGRVVVVDMYASDEPAKAAPVLIPAPVVVTPPPWRASSRPGVRHSRSPRSGFPRSQFPCRRCRTPYRDRPTYGSPAIRA
jgi:ubiquinone/menaquinone biosynthesis C-methylase UbiE